MWRRQKTRTRIREVTNIQPLGMWTTKPNIARFYQTKYLNFSHFYETFYLLDGKHSKQNVHFVTS